MTSRPNVDKAVFITVIIIFFSVWNSRKGAKNSLAPFAKIRNKKYDKLKKPLSVFEDLM